MLFKNVNEPLLEPPKLESFEIFDLLLLVLNLMYTELSLTGSLLKTFSDFLNVVPLSYSCTI